MESNSLQNVFNSYSKDGQMECSKCNKLFKDVGLIGKNLSTTDIDIMFSKVKEKSLKKISLIQFEELVKLVSEKLKKELNEIKQKLSGQKGPEYNATVPDNVKFHDDKSLYTGVHAKGGPSTIDKDNINSLANLCDRTEADNRGVKKQ